MGVIPDRHDFQRVGSLVKVISIIVLIAGLGWAIYAGIIRPVTKPNPSNKQEGQRDNYNVTIAPKSYFGCMRFDIKRPGELPAQKKQALDRPPEQPVIDKLGDR